MKAKIFVSGQASPQESGAALEGQINEWLSGVPGVKVTRTQLTSVPASDNGPPLFVYLILYEEAANPVGVLAVGKTKPVIKGRRA